MNSEKGFKYSLGVLAVFIVMVLMHIFQQYVPLDLSYIYGILSIIIVGLISFGVYYTIVGLREKKSARKIIGLVLNTSYLILFIALIIANTLDIYKAVK